MEGVGGVVVLGEEVEAEDDAHDDGGEEERRQEHRLLPLRGRLMMGRDGVMGEKGGGEGEG